MDRILEGCIEPGMTYRQWLIGQALTGILASSDVKTTNWSDMGLLAVQAADQVIHELDREEIET